MLTIQVKYLIPKYVSIHLRCRDVASGELMIFVICENLIFMLTFKSYIRGTLCEIYVPTIQSLSENFGIYPYSLTKRYYHLTSPDLKLVGNLHSRIPIVSQIDITSPDLKLAGIPALHSRVFRLHRKITIHSKLSFLSLALLSKLCHHIL